MQVLMQVFTQVFLPFPRCSQKLSLFKPYSHGRKSALKQALNWTISKDIILDLFYTNGPTKSFFSADLGLCEPPLGFLGAFVKKKES